MRISELRDGDICSRCELDGEKLLIVPHPLARLQARRCDCPSQAEIVWRFTDVAMHIIGESAEIPSRRFARENTPFCAWMLSNVPKQT
jgi:hypothetical protein